MRGADTVSHMYAAPHFRETRREVLLDTIREIGVVTLVSPTAEGLIATFVPVMVAGDIDAPVLIGHIARANSQWQHPTEQQALAVAVGPSAYVSPNWYPSKQQDPRVVPTWNYVHVQAHGSLEWLPNPDDTLAIVSMLTDHHEASLEHPWAVSDAPDDFVAQKLRGVVGFRFQVEQLEGSFKLSQNQEEANGHGVLEGLGATTGRRQADVAAQMRRIRAE